MEYARAKNFGFLEVSSKTGSNIKAAYNCLVRGIYLIRYKFHIPVEIYKNQSLEEEGSQIKKNGMSGGLSLSKKPS
jgi:hypothetical protein